MTATSMTPPATGIVGGAPVQAELLELDTSETLGGRTVTDRVALVGDRR